MNLRKDHYRAASPTRDCIARVKQRRLRSRVPAVALKKEADGGEDDTPPIAPGATGGIALVPAVAAW